MRTFLLIAVVALLAAAVPAATAEPQPGGTADRATARAALEQARELWRKQGLRDYSFRLRVSCFCPQSEPITITVRNGQARGATGFAKTLRTFPRMFATIAKTLDDEQAGAVNVRYDKRRGFPRTASLDSIELAADDEFGWTVDRFRALRRR